MNSQIKALTGDNTEANIVAHALWGAIEAQASGNSALAGATAAASGEVAAAFLTKQLYGKAPKDLTASEKETISGLSQIVGALSSVAVANNSSDGYRGAEVAESAVENNYLTEVEAKNFIEEYQDARTKEDKRNVLIKYTLLSKENDKNFDEICSIDPVGCINLIDQAKVGSDVLTNNQNDFGLSSYFSTILNSNYRAENNKEWSSPHIFDLIPDKINRVQPDQELANKLAKGISERVIPLTKKSADLLYQLNTDERLAVYYDPSKIEVIGFPKDNPKKISGRVKYTDWVNWSVFGSVLINKRENGSYHIYDDKYDFNIIENNHPKVILRNIETYLGEPKGGGVPYIFEFDRNKGVVYEKDD
ncbi:VENN motif pre-toxin domain-containing protein [Testudinibacter sp. TR-2022]|uniref:VENN motif pre-toxin domain-containing protein n=2 Tax=Testudinibacter sp. TR-2022 TaxID=2585029 RepID=UPI00159BB720|nr:VENN motif pre-toxin domain-containing protein [Testudinibacter sp. TR-2022]